LKPEAKSTILSHLPEQSPRETLRKGSPLQTKLKAVKLFDVDVKIARD